MTPQILCRYRLLTILAFFLSGAACLPASASDQPIYQVPSITVKFGDLDLNTDAGVRELLDRVSQAADRVCRAHAITYATLGYPHVYELCYRHSVAAAVHKIHQERLSTLFAAMSRPNTR